MSRHLYSLLFASLIPAVLCRLWWRGRSLPAYRQRWSERFAHFPTPGFTKPVIWVHTVSVGEFIAARPMIDQLLARDSHQLVITTMTPTGSERVNDAYGNRVFHVYAPYDIPTIVHRFLVKTDPRLAIFLETELWPNLLHGCHQKKIPTILANARLSEKSARGYAKVAWLVRPMLKTLSVAAIQNPADAERFTALGLAPERAQITGSIKFDITLSEAMIERAALLKKQLSVDGSRKIWIAASTHRGEDALILDAFTQLQKLLPDHRLILVPRHPDRFEEVYQLCVQRGFATVRRSAIGDQLANREFAILLGDTMGELMLLFGCADAAFVGGSLVNNGGHNTIEPSIWGIPVLSGPSQFNFAAISQLLNDANALVTIHSSDELSSALHECLTTHKGELYGRAAQRVARQNQGALTRLITIIDHFLQ